MKKSIFIGLMMLMVLAVAPASYATDMYSDLAAWTAAAGGTAKSVDMAALTEYDAITQLSLIGGGTITFDSALTVYMANGSWATWPNAYNGPVLYTNGDNSVAGTFSAPALAFGLWMEPNPWSVYNMTMGLSDGSSLTQAVDGYFGGLFFGWANWNGGDTQVLTLSIEGQTDFAFSVSPSDRPIPTPEPGLMILLGSGLLGLVSLRKRLA